MSTPSFSDQPAARRRVLRANWDVLRDVLPTATIGRKYDIDCLMIEGVVVCGLKGFTNHNSFFPFSGGVLNRVKKLPAGYSATQGALRFPIDEVISTALVKQLVRIRLAEMASATAGKRIVTYPNGSVKAVGSMRKGKLHGSWKWYRQDGSLMRSGSFRDGVQTGTWVTYDSGGRVVTKRAIARRASR